MSISEHRAMIVKISRRIETVNSDRMWNAGQRVINEHWHAIEALIGAQVVSVPDDPAKPLCVK